jgi:hypothetical protein
MFSLSGEGGEEEDTLQPEAIVELLAICQRTTCFYVDDNFFQQKDGMAIGSPVSLIVSNIYVEHFKTLLLTWYSRNCRCGSTTLMIHLWSGLMAQSSYSISSETLIV